MSKYKAKKITVGELTFDSKREYNRWLLLKNLESKGEIKDLQRQVKFILIPCQREPDTIGSRGGIHKGKVLEKECSYYADFTYIKDGELVVEDSKGLRLQDYIIKRKLMLYIHNIQIREV